MACPVPSARLLRMVVQAALSPNLLLTRASMYAVSAAADPGTQDRLSTKTPGELSQKSSTASVTMCASYRGGGGAGGFVFAAMLAYPADASRGIPPDG